MTSNDRDKGVALGRRPRTPGEEGLRDCLAMEAIYRSTATGRPVAVEPVAGLDASRGPEAEKAG